MQTKILSTQGGKDKGQRKRDEKEEQDGNE